MKAKSPQFRLGGYPLRIYLDHNATSPLNAQHWQSLADRLQLTSTQNNWQAIGNPSSPHQEGRMAQTLLTHARRALASSLALSPHEVYFTGSATESNNTAIYSYGAGHAVSSTIEHPSVREPLLSTAKSANSRSWVSPSRDPVLFLQDLIRTIRTDTTLVTFMSANNETGERLPTKEFGDFLHELRYGHSANSFLSSEVMQSLHSVLDPILDQSFFRNLHFHVDATQTYGKLPISEWLSPGIDSLSLSAHKLGGLMGAGALIVRRGRNLSPLLRGGGQERVKRAGTENLVGATSLGLIAESVSIDEHWTQIDRMRSLTVKLEATLRARPELAVLSNASIGLPNTAHALILNDSFTSEDVLIGLDLEGISASSGSACSSGANRPSRVIEALLRSSNGIVPDTIGNPSDMQISSFAKNGLRFSLSKQTSEKEIHLSCQAISKVMTQLAKIPNHR